MSSSIYQGLQSCLEPRLTESRILRLKLTPSKSTSSRPPAEDSELISATHFYPKTETHLEMGETSSAANAAPAVDMTAANGGGSNGAGGWSSLQTLSSASDGIRNEKAAYVHPTTKQYSPATLSEKSLEMCTESLGSETGSDGSEIGGDEKMSLFPSDETETPPFATGENPQPRCSRLRELRAAKKLGKPRSSFPPPLTSVSGPVGVKVKPYREGGRLVLKAVSFPSVKPCFEVERGGGRLRLRLLKQHCLFSDGGFGEEGEEEEEEEGGEGAEEEEEEEEEESNESVGKRRRGRRCRCKEGGGGRKGLLNWEPFLVST